MHIITPPRPRGEDPTPHQALLTSGEAAAVLQVVPQTIIRWANDGTLPCTRTAGGHRRFRESDVAALRVRLYGPDRDPEAGAVSQALAAPAPSALSQLHPDLVTELARFLALEAGWAPEGLDGFGGDPDFTAEVQAAMADLLAGGER